MFLSKINKRYNEYNDFTQSILLFIPLIILYELGLVFFIGLNHSLWGDERHFYEAILFFKKLDLKKIVDYKEVTPPLVYLLYATWGKLVGFELFALRILSLFVSAGVGISFYYIIWLIFRKKTLAIIGAFLFMLNPYVIGMSIFIYTDMLTILFILLLLIGMLKNNILLMSLSLGFALLTRQYSVIFLVAISVYFFNNSINNPFIVLVLYLGRNIASIRIKILGR